MPARSQVVFHGADARDFEVMRLVFSFEALDSLCLPFYGGSAFRGLLGRALKPLACTRRCETAIDDTSLPACEDCDAHLHCEYTYLFETLPPAGADIRGGDDVPRPFVLEPPVGEREVAPGGGFEVSLLLLGRGVSYWGSFVAAMAEVGHIGLYGRPVRQQGGPVSSSAHFRLRSVHAHDACGHAVEIPGPRPCSPSLHAPPGDVASPPVVRMADVIAGNEDCNDVEILFSSPTRFKQANDLVVRPPEFHVLVRALLRRLHLLMSCHGSGPLQVPFTELARAADEVSLAGSDLTWHDLERHSSRQQRYHKMGGLMGRVRYSGQLGPFLPLLRAGTLIHVGGKTTFGLGAYRLAVGRP